MEPSKFMKHKEREVVMLLKISKSITCFLSRSFCPSGSDYSTKERRISLLHGVPMLSEHEKTPISTGNERLDQLGQGVPLYSDVPKIFQSQNSAISYSAKSKKKPETVKFQAF